MTASDASCLVLDGALTQERVPELWQQRGQWQAVRQLDLSAVTAVDSAGLAMLLELETQARQQGTPLSWLHCPPALNRLMQLYDLELVEDRLTGA
ncbi:lipid asymmetry maintenance protein MlaB [Ferrimonas balearica]|uniref:STAS domain-containing protein n=1 Tax=Ferrimonas balearica TaxID=44012 RepID=UPI001C997017|nr:STAS domain-containing protein [Ferrimonas balearica]MBY5993091.1 STAS domain-containing protein [Ferrimonas balearica]